MKITIVQWCGFNPRNWGFCGAHGLKRVFFDVGRKDLVNTDPGKKTKVAFYTIGPALIKVCGPAKTWSWGAEGGYHVATPREVFWFDIRNAHLPLIGHRLSQRCVQLRPKMYCGTCNKP